MDNSTDLTHTIDLNPVFDIMNITNPSNELWKSESDKDESIDEYINSLFLPYYIYMKLLMNEDNIYNKIKKNQQGSDSKELNIINLYFLMEIIKKKIECIDTT